MEPHGYDLTMRRQRGRHGFEDRAADGLEFGLFGGGDLAAARHDRYGRRVQMLREAVEQPELTDGLSTNPGIGPVLNRPHVVGNDRNVGQTELTDAYLKKICPPLPPFD